MENEFEQQGDRYSYMQKAEKYIWAAVLEIVKKLEKSRQREGAAGTGWYWQ